MNYNQLQGKLRTNILKMHFNAHSGHIGCSLSCIDIMVSILKYKKEADTFILSKGHAATALYTILNETGDIPDEDLDTFYKDNTTLPAHPAPLKYSAIPFATGSLGHGLPLATGIAIANKLKRKEHLSFVLMSDGETNEGTSWEAAHFAVANKLDNLIAFIDRNGLQGFGNTKDILGDTASVKLWEAMGFEVIEMDGHDIAGLVHAWQKLSVSKNGKPKMVIAQTVKGKGVQYMQDKMEWHYLPMTASQYQEGLRDIQHNYGFTNV